MNCKEFNDLLNKYLAGDLSPSEEETVQHHLEKCPACQQVLEMRLAKSELPNIKELKKEGESFSPSLEEKKQDRILFRAKYKHRFMTAFFVLLLFFVLQIAGTFLSSLFYNSGGENSRMYKAQKTAIILTEFNMPNVRLPIGMSSWPGFFSQAGWGHSNLQIKPYFAAKGVYALEKTIGKKTYPVGTLNLNYFFSLLNTRWNWENGSYENTLYFVHPQETKEDNSEPSRMQEKVWDALEILPEGTVAELALSFDRTYSLNDLHSLLADYDLDITWYAVSTGMESNPDRNNHRPVLSAFNGAWGFASMSHIMRSQYSEINLADYSQQEEFFLNSMEYLVQNEQYARKIYRGDRKQLNLSERLEYLKENGIQIYGAVVTGPSKELLKLSELNTVRYPALGEIELWNWFYPNFSGNLY